MTIDEQLRDVAATMDARQRPVTADEVLTRGPAGADDEPGPPWRWVLVAAAFCVLVGGLVAFAAYGGDDEMPSVVTDPDTSHPAPTDPDHSGDSPNRPTLEYRDGVDWWVPEELPDGWRYGYASDDGTTRRIRLFGPDGHMTLEIVLGEGGRFSQLLGESEQPLSEQLGDMDWAIVGTPDDAAIQHRGSDTGLVTLEVDGPLDVARVVAASLRQVPESDLERPPFHADAPPGPVVLTVPAADLGTIDDYEVRAHTDGMFTTVGGDIKQVTADDPLAFGDYVYERVPGADTVHVVLPGVALAGLDEISFGLLAGDMAAVTPTSSDRFSEDFFALVFDVPADVIDSYEAGAIDKLTRWTLTHVDGAQRVYGEVGVEGCVACEAEVDGEDGDPFADSTGTGPLPNPIAEALTNYYRGDVSWWIPAAVPDGYRFMYAQETQDGTRQLAYLSDDASARSGASIWIVPPGQASDWLDNIPDDASEVDVGGTTWWYFSSFMGHVLGRPEGDELIQVTAPTYDDAVALATMLELRPERDLERPPYRAETSVVVATLPAAEALATAPVELHAATDGVTLLVDGGPPLLTIEQPLQLLGLTIPEGGGIATVAGITAPGVAIVEVEQLDGTRVTVRPVDQSRLFNVGFVFVAVEIPEVAGPEAENDFASLVASIIVRDWDGNILLALNEPF